MRIATVVFFLVLVGCAGSAPQRTEYLLRAAPGEHTGRVDAPVRVGLGRVAVAPYLDRAGIVVETAAGQVQPARQHQWAEPLEAGLRSTLRDEIASALGHAVLARPGGGPPWDHTVDVYVDRLHGTMNGTAVVDAGYRITPQADAEGAAEYRFSRSVPLAREGYAGLVDAEARLVRELGRAIAASLREMRAPGGS